MTDSPWKVVEDETPDTPRDVVISDGGTDCFVAYHHRSDGSWWAIDPSGGHTMLDRYVAILWMEIPDIPFQY